MKTGVYFLLFAITFLHEYGTLLPANAILGSSLGNAPPTDPEVPPVDKAPEIPEVPTIDSIPGLPEKCLIDAFTNSGQLLLRTGTLVCMYNKGMKTLNDQNIEAVFQSLKDTLVNTLCAVDNVLNTAETLKKVAIPVSEITKKLIDLILPILDKSGLSEAIMENLCTMLLPALSPDCLPALVAVDVVKLILDMKLHACNGENEHLFYEDTIAILKRLGCVLRCPADLLALSPAIEPVPNPDLPAIEPVPKPDLPAIEPVPVPNPYLPAIEPVPKPDLPAIEPAPVPKPDLPVTVPDITKVTTVPYVPSTDVPSPSPTVPSPTPVTEPKTVPSAPLGLVKRDLGDSIPPPNVDAPVPVPPLPSIPQGGPKDPVVKVACIAVELLLKGVTPV